MLPLIYNTILIVTPITQLMKTHVTALLARPGPPLSIRLLHAILVGGHFPPKINDDLCLAFNINPSSMGGRKLSIITDRGCRGGWGLVTASPVHLQMVSDLPLSVYYLLVESERFCRFGHTIYCPSLQIRDDNDGAGKKGIAFLNILFQFWHIMRKCKLSITMNASIYKLVFVTLNQTWL